MGIRAHYATAGGGYGPVAHDDMGSWYLDEDPQYIVSGHHLAFGTVSLLPNWPPYVATVWGDIRVRCATAGSSSIDVLLGSSYFYDDGGDVWGWRIAGEVQLGSFTVTSTNWQDFIILPRTMLFGNPIRDSNMPGVNYDNYISTGPPEMYWDAPFSYWWYNASYLPWIRVNSGSNLYVYGLRLWDETPPKN